MPIYEYNCTHCHSQFDLLQKLNDAPATQCPHCGESTAVRLVSAAAFQLKGSGWYATDFKNKSADPKKTDTVSSDTSSSEKKVQEPQKSTETSTSTPETKGE